MKNKLDEKLLKFINKHMPEILISSITLVGMNFTAVALHNHKPLHEKYIRKNCSIVGYPYPERVKKIKEFYLNKDSARDYILYLNDGTRLRYVSRLNYDLVGFEREK